MAQPFVPGPAPVWISFRGEDDSAVRFLGYTGRGVDLEINPEYSHFVTDVGGSVPVDLIYQGMSGTLSFDLTRWQEQTYAILASHAAKSAINPIRGADLSGRVGTIMHLERANFVVYVAFPYSAGNPHHHASWLSLPQLRR